ncbi:hypothetical protein EI285_03585 [Aliarcobacter skirrowii]|uniref:hypothetical protein n=1 Tax=Aliarcobacter skirrowii TaxID=28200 RepID=UPI000F65923F|nr:hypothetical protein [Aliarcobacter skirrowii]AZL53706.1 hypothetical protein EI285_03585 [Aliarcobacter skirrowii]
MNISKYIQHRHNLEQLNIGNINKSVYENISDNYTRLLKVSEDNPSKLPVNFGDKYILWFFVFIGFLLSIIFSMGYLDGEKKHLDIIVYYFFVIVIPLIILISSFVYKIYKQIRKIKSNFLNKLFEWLFKKEFFINKLILQDVIKISSSFHFNIISISYSIFSILWLIIFTMFKGYTYIWDSSWLTIKIMKFSSKILEFINFNLVPNELNQGLVKKFESSEENWLWFLIVLTIVWIIIPKILLLIFNKYKVQKKLNYSFVDNSKSKHILKYINPETSTGDENIEQNQSKETNKVRTFSQIIKFDLSQSNITNFKTLLLWHLTEEAILNMRNNLNNTNIDLIVLKSARELNLENIRKESSLLIIINVDNTPQGKFIRLLERVSEFNVTIKFIDEKGEFTNSNKNIAEWSRFLEENNIRIEVINE